MGGLLTNGKMTFNLLSIVLVITSTFAASPTRPTSRPTSKPTPAPTSEFRDAYSNYNVSGLDSSDFAMISTTSEETSFRAQMVDDVVTAINADSAIRSDVLGGVSVAISKNASTGTMDMMAQIQIYWNSVDDLLDNQRGNTGNFAGLMQESIRSYFNNSDSIMFTFETVWMDSANSHIVAFSVIASLFVLMNL